MTYKRVLVILLTILMFPLEGCWDRKELNQLGIAVAIGIDSAPNNQLKVTAQVVIPAQIAQNNSSKNVGSNVTLFEAVAPTLTEAIQMITEISPRRIYLGHIKMFILGEAFARKGIADVVETMVRAPQTRADYYVAVAKGRRAEEILQITTPLESIPANKLFTSLEASSEDWAPTIKITVDELLHNLLTNGRPVLTGIRIVGDYQEGIGDSPRNFETSKPATQLQFTGLAYFKKDRLIGWLDEVESRGYNYINNRVDQMVGHTDLPGGGRFGMHVLRTDTKVKVILDEGEPTFKVIVSIKGRITEVQKTSQNVRTSNNLRHLEKLASAKLAQLMKSSVESTRRRFKMDVFGFGQFVHEAYPKVWKSLEHEWDRVFMNAKIDYDVNVSIGKVGTLLGTFQDVMRE